MKESKLLSYGNKTIIFGIIIALAVIGGLFFMVSSNTNTQTMDDKLKTETIITSNATDPATATNSAQTKDGLIIEDIKVGTGEEVKAGDRVVMHYTGTLENGTKFDSSVDRGQPFETQIGVGEVIKGWDEGVPGMKVGGKRKLIIPPTLGYGAQAVGAIPANSTLIFEVELLEIK